MKTFWVRMLVVVGLVGSGVAAWAQATGDEAALPAAFRSVSWRPSAQVQGSVTLVTVEMAKPAARVTGLLLGREIVFFKGEKADTWYGLAGVDLEVKPGVYPLRVTAAVQGKGLVRAERKIEIGDGGFREGSVTVPEDFVHPGAAERRQIAQDNAVKARAYAHFVKEPLWSGDFIKPVNGPSTPSFGMTRTLNEEAASQHKGTDFPVNEGSAVEASNAGVVVLAKEMFYEGGCVIVDHGQHFFTIYMHLSKMDVGVGDTVKKGQKLGLSGSTGRVTGPHLHMGVRWNGAYVDPVRLIGLTLPSTGAAAGGIDSRTPRRAGARAR